MEPKKSCAQYLAKEHTLGLNAIFQNFLNRETTNYYDWSKILDKYLLNCHLNRDSIIIEHSLGAHFILKYIAEKEIKIKSIYRLCSFLNKIYKENKFNKIIYEFLQT